MEVHHDANQRCNKNLKKFGWVPYRDDIGHYHAFYYLSDLFVSIDYEVKYGWRDRKLMLVANLSTIPYLLAWEYIKGERLCSESILFSEDRYFDVKMKDLSENRIQESLNKIITWAKTQNIEQKLHQEASNGSSKSSVVARVLLDDIESLKLCSPTSNLNIAEFSDYKTTTWIERFLLFVQAYKNSALDDIWVRTTPQKQLMSLTAATNIF
ncbi:DUF6990 domain-containing protein [Bartonella sp. TT121SHDZB]|uniref:DUF6990 domain-containing protein n=1 Tax=Bartonella sp. TT121SHDZB TaxID=3243580 RepID=UPI0035CF3903